MLEQDLSRANQIQLRLLPDKIPYIPGCDMKLHYVSCKETGGDYYDFIEIDKDHLGIVIADVSGKGISGAMIMILARTVIRLIAQGNPDARETIVRANRIIAPDVKDIMFMTLLYMVLDKNTYTIEVVNAGHNPLIYWDGREHRRINPQGIALGFDLGPLFEANLKSETIVLRPDDYIVAYTDGVVESLDSKGREFGEDRFLEIIETYGSAQPPNDLINSLVKALEAHQGDAPQYDDITVVKLKFNGRNAPTIS
jgi:sigma-B regulation protein RsbU (phosphoserine phosphatase)